MIWAKDSILCGMNAKNINNNNKNFTIMKKEELMIGDWVMYDGTPLQVAEIYDAGISARGMMAGYTFEHLEPILLTPEILEKNGCALDEIDGSYRYPDLGLWIGGRYAPFGCLISNVYVELNYVHELQHALRMCGIEKEIEL